MPFRLKSNEPIADGLRRLAGEELRSISKHLDGAAAPQAEAVHDIRKSVKKVHAIVEIIDVDDRRRLARSAKRLHRINRRLSELRDADVMLDTLKTLRRRDRRTVNERCFARVQRRLSSHRRSVMRTAHRKGTWRRVRRSVRKLRRDARFWKTKHRHGAFLVASVLRTHERGLKAMTRARRSHRAADFHEWRKQVKALWYELKLVEDSGPRIKRDVRALGRAEACLGNDHNVVVLLDELSKAAPGVESRADLDRVRLAGDRYQEALRKKAWAITKAIYARVPRAYAKSIKREWKRWHTSR